MKDELVTFPTAKLAKEKGFNEFCIYSWYKNIEGKYNIITDYNDPDKNSELFDDNYTIPTQSLLQRWLREVHGLHISFGFVYAASEGKFHGFLCTIRSLNTDMNDKTPIKRGIGGNFEGRYYTYEEALELALQEALLIP
jgi:hypothetical protein